MCSFVLGTSETWHDKNGEFNERTVWHKVVAWGDFARFCGKLKKGSEIFFLGKLTERKYQDQDGKPVAKTEVQIQGFLRLV